MPVVMPSKLPHAALLAKYSERVGFTDCYVTEVSGRVGHEEFVRAFYTSPLFKVERAILKWFVSRPSTDEDANALASGSTTKFAAWRVEDRAQNQLLLSDFTGRTRSWLMTIAAKNNRGEPVTLLYFGSAVVPRVNRSTGKATLGVAFTALLGFHRLYSRLLLYAARRRVLRKG